MNKINLFLINFLLFSMTMSTSITVAQKIDQKKTKKIALVIGVANYQFANPLKNPLNDAKDLDSMLTALGFEVSMLKDPSLKEMAAAIDSFEKRIVEANVCLFYYSGHGAEYNGENFLFPKTAHPLVPGDLSYESYPLGKIMSKIDFAEVKTSIILLDACRSNPFTRAWKKSMSTYEGLANVDIPDGTFIGYAASPGKTAFDGIKKNGIYTEAILKYIKDTTQSIDRLFNKVNKEVRVQTLGKQIPFKSSSLDDDFYFGQNKAITKSNNNAKVDLSNKEKFFTASPSANKFPLPPIMKGYSLNLLNSFANVRINRDVFKKEHDSIELYISLMNQNIWDKTTPVYIGIVKKWSREAEAGIYVFRNEYQLSEMNHQIKIENKFNPGIYELRVGFYFVSELNTEYPPFNSRIFTFTIE